MGGHINLRGATHLESSTREWCEQEIEQTKLPKQRVLCEQWAENGTLSQPHCFRGAQRKRRTKKDMENKKNGVMGARGRVFKEEGDGLRAQCSSHMQADGHAFGTTWPGSGCWGSFRGVLGAEAR